MHIRYISRSEPLKKNFFQKFAGLILLAAILAASMLIPPYHDTIVVTCLWKNIFGIPCPGCGMTRAFLFLGHGRLYEGFRMNPGSFLAFSIIIALFVNKISQIMFGKEVRITLNSLEKFFVYIAAGTIMVSVWVYNLKFNPWV